MSLAHEMQNFLKRKLEEMNLKRKAFAEDSGIPYPTVCKTINAANRNVELRTVLRLAKYFHCSLDEVMGRDNFANTAQRNFKDISVDEISSKLKNYIKHEMSKNSLSPYQLAKNCDLGETTIYEYIKDNGTKKMLSAGAILNIANYLNVSLDEMIGRTSPPISKTLQSLSPEIQASVEQIRDLIKSGDTKTQNPTKTIPLKPTKDLSRT
jgi:transcriptional regulator with XRE-family HTH domain